MRRSTNILEGHLQVRITGMRKLELINVTECLLLFGQHPSVYHFAIQTYK